MSYNIIFSGTPEYTSENAIKIINLIDEYPSTILNKFEIKKICDFKNLTKLYISFNISYNNTKATDDFYTKIANMMLVLGKSTIHISSLISDDRIVNV
jgi:hypothetical protein